MKDLDPYLHDPDCWGTSLAQSAEIMLPCLDAAGARSVVEIGAFAGDLTRVLVAWAAGAGARVAAIDPAPQPGLERLAREHQELELIRRTSLEALPDVALPDAVVVDGDHNYYTVSEELRLIGERAPGAELPLLLFHDVCWPHGRRDDYFAPEQIAAEFRRPVAGDRGGIVPGDPGLRPEGLPYRGSAAQEGGPRNGVLTAVEDFVAERPGLRLAIVPAFFGLGVVWREDADYADAVAAVVDRWDRDPVLERLEANRVLHLASSHCQITRAHALEQRNQRLEELLEGLLKSRAFSLAERISKLRGRGEPLISKELIRRALDG